MPSSAHRKPPTAHHEPTSAGLAALASVAATGEGILAVACPYFLESMPPGSPVQYTFTCNTGNMVLYGRPSRSPWKSLLIIGLHFLFPLPMRYTQTVIQM